MRPAGVASSELDDGEVSARRAGHALHPSRSTVGLPHSAEAIIDHDAGRVRDPSGEPADDLDPRVCSDLALRCTSGGGVSVVIGWDIGGAHLKAVRVRGRPRRAPRFRRRRRCGSGSTASRPRSTGCSAQLGERRPSRDHHDRRIVRRLCLATRGRRGSRCDRRMPSRPRGCEPLRGPCRLRPARRGGLARRRHRLGQLARERRARRRSSFRTRCSSISARRRPISSPSSPARSPQSATATRNGSPRANSSTPE